MQYWDKMSAYIQLTVEKICCYLLIILVFSEISIVMLRYIYNVGFLKLHGVALYSFSALVILSILYSFGCNSHVRVDVFRDKHSDKTKRRVDILAVLFCLFPLFSFIIYWVWPDISYAWSIFEGSRETGGLAGLFLVKSVLPLVAVLMIVQGIYVILNRGLYLTNNDIEPTIGETS